jgi:hypothetical protein
MKAVHRDLGDPPRQMLERLGAGGSDRASVRAALASGPSSQPVLENVGMKR